MKKIFTVLSLVFILNTSVTYAFGKIVLDPSNLARNIITSVQTFNTAKNIINTTLKEISLDKIAFNAGNAAIADITSQTNNWIQTGFNGRPLFVDDPQELFDDISEDESLLLTKKIKENETLFAANSEVLKYFSSSISEDEDEDFLDSIDPTLDDIVCNKLAKDLSDAEDGEGDPESARAEYNNVCVNGDAKQKIEAQEECAADYSCGGMDAILAMTQDPDRNTPLGRLGRIIEEAADRAEEEKKKIEDELDRGQGFLGQKQCIKSEKVEGKEICLEYKTVVPGSVVSGLAQKISVTPIDQALRVDEDGEKPPANASSFIAKLIGGISLNASLGGTSVSVRGGNGNSNVTGGPTVSVPASGSGQSQNQTQNQNQSQSQSRSPDAALVYVSGPGSVASSYILYDPDAPEEKPDVDTETNRQYLNIIKTVVESAIQMNRDARLLAEKESSYYTNVFNAYSEVSSCYRVKYDEQRVKTFKYPDIIPVEIRNRTAEVYNIKQDIGRQIEKSNEAEVMASKRYDIIKGSKTVEVMKYHFAKIQEEMSQQENDEKAKAINFGYWSGRDSINTYGDDGEESNALYAKLEREARETLRKIDTGATGDSRDDRDVSPLAVCRALDPNPSESGSVGGI